MAIGRCEFFGGMAMIATGIYLGLRHISQAIEQSFREVTEQAIYLTGKAEIKVSTTDVSTTIVAGPCTDH